MSIEILLPKDRDPKPENLYRAMKYGDSPVNVEAAMDIEAQYPHAGAGHHLSNFQNMFVYNKHTDDFGDVSNWLYIPHADFHRMAKWQPTGDNDFERLKWFSLGPTGAMYLWLEPDWNPLEAIQHPEAAAFDLMWGTLVIGNNIVQVEGFETISVSTKADPSRTHPRAMARLAGFRKTDWDKPLDELVETGLVHRCYCAYGYENNMGDTPDGIRYSPFWSPLDWTFHRIRREVTHLYVPVEWLVKL